MKFEKIILEKKERVAVVTINHPPVNAWDLTTMENFAKALDVVEHDNGIRVVVITGGGEKCFSLGFDVNDSVNAAKTTPLGAELWKRVDRFTKPVIAAINGFALGGGFELALSCHFRIMVNAPKAKLGLTEINLGIVPGWGGTQRLARIIGKSKALDMILFSKRVGAKEAFEMGLVNQVAEPGKTLEDALKLAENLAKRPPLAVRCVLKAMSAGEYEGIDEGLRVEAEGNSNSRWNNVYRLILSTGKGKRISKF